MSMALPNIFSSFFAISHVEFASLKSLHSIVLWLDLQGDDLSAYVHSTYDHPFNDIFLSTFNHNYNGRERWKEMKGKQLHSSNLHLESAGTGWIFVANATVQEIEDRVFANSFASVSPSPS